ncbi:hypothetical protein TRP8649_01364 [Pelagimonas phthalicica]|uniref:Uncharacterized protein n=2 Tax=Pelagimonas phthalicica TaxID=1037362 RepID=A0A238J970_9RHOB|nr:hypothetical protein CLV87_0708 [Pelagimonas phthalicica]SMX27261.1 hypothetical protein TRP8649_01364 [Pelagimonas phthalicica]
MGAPRISAAIIKEAVAQVEETGVTVKIETKRTVVTISPPETLKPVNPADLIDP